MDDNENGNEQLDACAYTDEWMTLETHSAVSRITSGDAGKRQETVVQVAFARGMGFQLGPVFKLESVANQRVWYQEILPLKTVRAAYDLCLARVRAWRIERVTSAQTRYADGLRIAVAKGKIVAVEGLQVTAMRLDDSAPARTNASLELLKLDDSGFVRPEGEQAVLPVQVAVEGLDALIEHQLDRVAGGEGERAEG